MSNAPVSALQIPIGVWASEERVATMEGNDPREEAIAASPALQPDFVSPGITSAQINKLKELHQRRLQMKTSVRPRHRKSSKANVRIAEDAASVEEKADMGDAECQAYVSQASVTSDREIKKEEPQSYGWKKRQKLHWGLDTKERWERKANM